MASNVTLAKIHIAKAQLGMDEDTYRAMLRQHGGVKSSKELTPAAAAAVLQHLERAGFKPKTASKAGRSRPRVGTNRAALVKKIEALLAEAKRPWAYADALVKRMFANTTKVERIEFCDREHLMKVVAALSIDAKRRDQRDPPPAAVQE